MSRYWQHIPSQAAGISALGGLIRKAGVDALRKRRSPRPAEPASREVQPEGEELASQHAPFVGMTLRRSVHLPERRLQADFVRFCGGDPNRYAVSTPPHLFPQWVLPVALTMAKRLPYPPLSVINVGCTLRIDGPLPPQGLVDVSCTLTELVEKEGKVLLTLSLLTIVEHEVRLRSDLRLSVRVPQSGGSSRQGGAKRPKPVALVPAAARELVRQRLGPNAGLQFAELTGDFNPVHWVPAYARMIGFKAPILHGFGSLGLVFEAFTSARLSGRFEEVTRIEAEFTAPLPLPHEIGVFVQGDEVWVADAPGGPAYMVGRLEVH